MTMIEHMFASWSAACKGRARRPGPLPLSLPLLRAGAGVADLDELAPVHRHLAGRLDEIVCVQTAERPALLGTGLALRGRREEAHLPARPVVRGIRHLVVVDHVHRV